MGKSMEFWDPIETMDRREFERLQLKRLNKTIEFSVKNSRYYKDNIPQGLRNLNSLEDISKLPMMDKDDIRKDQESKPFLGEMLCVPEDDVVYISTSSGSTGMPTASPFTKKDFDVWIDYEARQFYSSGLRKSDRYCHALNLSLFVGGPCVLGAQRIGALSIHAGTMPSERLIKVIEHFRPNFIWTTPSYAWYLGETADKMGFDPAASSIKNIFVAGEPGGSIENTRKRIENLWDAKVFDYYGISDIFGSCAGECVDQNGLHVAEDHMIVEVVDTKTGEHVSEGEKGEMLLTTINKWARPLIRFRTGDIVTYETERCSCGRTSMRLMGIHGRIDDMLIIKGVNVMPSAIEAIIRSHPSLTGEYRIIVDREDHLDRVVVETEHTKKFAGNLSNLEEELKNEIRSKLGISTKVVIYDEETLPRATHKAKRLIDNRKDVWK
ncbi:MAG: phenylacetate--CoA ligase [Candidatus Methanofastidiosa archaeon]|nr:phenylacetate--CoA ligase [Candidatus Methanofastidiosa archaeon]